MPRKSSNKAKSQRRQERALLQKVHLNATGIDIGANAHWVAVPEDRDPSPVRSFGVFTRDLVALCDWLKRCQVETIVMESTGVYWIPLDQMLERKGSRVRQGGPGRITVDSGELRHVVADRDRLDGTAQVGHRSGSSPAEYVRDIFFAA